MPCSRIPDTQDLRKQAPIRVRRMAGDIHRQTKCSPVFLHTMTSDGADSQYYKIITARDLLEVADEFPRSRSQHSVW